MINKCKDCGINITDRAIYCKKHGYLHRILPKSYPNRVYKVNSGCFKKGHESWTQGKKLSIEHRKKLSQSQIGKHPVNESNWKKGHIPWNKGIHPKYIQDENHHNWKGDSVGYMALHSWIRRKLIKPIVCSSCNKIKNLDLSNISGKYKRDINDWQWLCRKCHHNFDRNSYPVGKKRDPEILKRAWVTRREKLCLSVA